MIKGIRYGINVRGEYATMIALGVKDIETRSQNVLRKLIGERVCIIKTSKVGAYIIGEVTIDEVKPYNSLKSFNDDFKRHFVDETSEYYPINYSDEKRFVRRYGYILSDPVIYDFPIAIDYNPKRGDNRSYRVIEFK